MLLGAHVSAQGGVSQAPANGTAIGCETIQIFAKNQRQWKAKPYSTEEVDAYRAAVKAAGFGKVVVHDSYLINLGAPDATVWKRSREAFADELARCHALGAFGLIFHPGAHVGSGEDACIRRIAGSIADVLSKADERATRLLIENTAGQGSNVGYAFEQVGRILELVDDERMGMCLDTQHAFAAGYDHRDEAGYARMFDEIADHVGVKRVCAFHLNDSKKPLGERVDRHENLGDGEIGWGLFERLVNDPRWAGVPGVLETPGGPERWKIELATLRNLRGPRAPDNGGAVTPATARPKRRR